MDPNIVNTIARLADSLIRDDGTEQPVISLATARSISLSSGIALREVEIAALTKGIVPLRYVRNTGTIGLNGQMRMLESTVAVVGAGGLGGTTIELLARHGVGRIIVIDHDHFSEPDLNRQIVLTEGDLGEPKAVVAAARATAVNSSTEVRIHHERLTTTNAAHLLRDARVVVDGLDNLASRFTVEDACRGLRTPYVYGTIAGLGGQIMTIFPQDPGLSSIYGPPGACSEQGIETSIGTPSVTPMIIAALQVQEVVKVITGVGVPIRNQILLVDASRPTIDAVGLSR